MAKTVMTISVDENIKKEFAKYAKSMWTNMTNLLSMFMATAPQSRRLEFFSPIEEVEPEDWEIKAIEEYREAKKNGNWEAELVSSDDFFNQFK